MVVGCDNKRFQQNSEWKESRQRRNCDLYEGAARYAANLPKGAHVFIEGELSYREYSRAIGSESGHVNVQLPAVEIVFESLKVLDRKRNETIDLNGALSGCVLSILFSIGEGKGV